MDLFRFDSPVGWQQGFAINGYTEVTWIERYRDPGEFQIKAPLGSGLKAQLPIGTPISHMRASEVCLVENHEISEDANKEPELIISGRSAEIILDQRVIGTAQNWSSPPATIPLGDTMFTNYLVVQLLQLANKYFGSSFDPNDALPPLNSMWVTYVFPAFTPPMYPTRSVKRGSLHTRMLELLDTEDVGIKTFRPDIPGSPDNSRLSLVMHYGTDKTANVTFSAQTGDIDTANYLWSNKELKNAALVTGKFVETVVTGPETGYARRYMFVDASDLDQSLTAVPTGLALTNMRAAMVVRGQEALDRQRLTTLADASISENRKYRYRTDFNIGDIINLDTSYGEITPMRVVEYAEIEDQDGERGYPTLAALP